MEEEWEYIHHYPADDEDYYGHDDVYFEDEYYL